mmetsp:Transcript_32677/g.101786  ORF Transcript_32677/g.101786 Transcript_32677/m.101786 type:complete len:200 (-) Transcript_32677:234-833(-)
MAPNAPAAAGSGWPAAPAAPAAPLQAGLAPSVAAAAAAVAQGPALHAYWAQPGCPARRPLPDLIPRLLALLRAPPLPRRALPLPPNWRHARWQRQPAWPPLPGSRRLALDPGAVPAGPPLMRRSPRAPPLRLCQPQPHLDRWRRRQLAVRHPTWLRQLLRWPPPLQPSKRHSLLQLRWRQLQTRCCWRLRCHLWPAVQG